MGRRGVTHRYLPTRAGTIHVYDAPNPAGATKTGNALLPTIVCLHGISASGTSFAPLFMRLREHTKRIIVPDYPGHGLSYEPSVRLTLDALFDGMTDALDTLLDGEPCVLVANSLGGAVALDYAAKRPSNVRAVVLLSPAGAASTVDEWNALMSAFDMPTRKDALVFMKRVYHRLPWIMRLLAHELPANVRRRGVSDLFGSVSHEKQVPGDELAKLPMPILFLWGQSERLLPDSHLAWWKQHLPKQAVIERPEGMGHCPHVDAPGPLARRIVAFLREHVTMAA